MVFDIREKASVQITLTSVRLVQRTTVRGGMWSTCTNNRGRSLQMEDPSPSSF